MQGQEDLAPPAVRDGEHVRIRPIRPTDALAHRELIARLSERTRRLRFNVELDRLTPAQTRFLVEVDHHRREALVAEMCNPGSAGDPWLIGVARYDTVGPGVVEMAVVVADEWQGRSLGLRLLHDLLLAASAAGIREITAQFRADNAAVWRLLRRPPLSEIVQVDDHRDEAERVVRCRVADLVAAATRLRGGRVGPPAVPPARKAS